MIQKFWCLFKKDNTDYSKQARMTNELYATGVITKENALDNLWLYFERAKDSQLKLQIAQRIKRIERRW